LKKIPTLLGALIFCASPVIACPTEIELTKNAAEVVYQDADAKFYICGESAATCDLSEFISKLQISPINLKAGQKINAGRKDGLLILPLNPAKQFFSALFLLEKCTYKMIFSPDVSQNGLSIQKKYVSGMPVILTRSQESYDRWSETEYVYSIASQAYVEKNTQCFYMTKNSKIANRKCAGQ
jgi:hypothetical protein